MFANENIENIVLLGSTRVGSRCVIQISAGFMIFIASRQVWSIICINTFHYICSYMEYCVMLGLVASVGLALLQFTNINSLRNIFIVEVSLLLGLGLSIPEYFRL